MRINPRFKLNNQSFDLKGLLEFSESLLHEREPNLIDLGRFIIDWCSTSDFISLATSGSTGTPKFIKASKSQMVNSSLLTANFFSLNEGDTALCCLPLRYIAGKMMLVRAFVLGLQIEVVSPSKRPLELASGTYFDFCAMVPMQLQNSIQSLDKIKTLIVGGAAVPTSLYKQINSSCKIYETFGMTETLSHVAIRRFSINSLYFQALKGVNFSVDSRNCLIIDAPKLHPKKLTTNDVVQLKGEKKFKWLGRIDRVVNSGGVKLHPEIIESKIAVQISNRFFVSSIPDSILGQALIVVIESAKVYSKPFKGLEKYEIPKQIYTVKKFEQTHTGKIDRRATLVKLKLV